MRVPSAVVAVPLLAGCCAGILLADRPDSTLPLCAAAAAAIALIAALGFFSDSFDARVVCALTAACALAGCSLGLTGARRAYRPGLLTFFDSLDPAARDAPTVVEGVLREDAALTAAGISLTLEVHTVVVAGRVETRTSGGLRLIVAGTAAAARMDAWRAGRALRMPVLLRRPTGYGDPGVADDVKGLARRGVVLLGTVKSGALVEVVAAGSLLEEAAARARRWARRQLAAHVGRWSGQSGAIASAILIGDRTGLSDEDERRLQEAGTYHVIAISGGNIAILTALMLVTLRSIGVRSELAAGLSIAGLLFFAEVASGGASVTRAVAAACIVLASRMLDHRGPPLNALGIAAIGSVAASPLAAFDSGFILSFGATVGILLGAPRMFQSSAEAGPPVRRSRSTEVHKRIISSLFGAARALFIATVCAEIALAPAGAELFSRITFAGLALNFAAIPLMTIAQIAAMCALAAASISASAASSCGYVAHLAAANLVRSAALVDIAPWLSRDVPPPAWWVVCVYYACCALLLTRRGSRLGACGVAAAGALMLIAPPGATDVGITPPGRGVLRVVFLDVGQGDATVVRMPDGRVLLVDAGGLPGSAFDIGERVLAPALRALGIRAVDTLVVTHGDPDHNGGASAVLRRFGPRVVWEGAPVPPHAGLRDLAARATASGVSWRTVQAGDRETAGGALIRILHPPLPDWERQRVRNEDSVVIELRVGDVSIILPGDIGREAENLITPELDTGRLTIVKAPHHGSATSSTDRFVEALQPAAVVFSAGRGNRFGHPAPLVVSRYRAVHAQVFRTDEDGAIVLDTDGKSVEMRTWSGRRVSLR
jgi:competence protein ComEC